jgi:hypothetical protein
LKKDTDVEAKRQKRYYTNRNSGSCTDDNTTSSRSRKRPNLQVTSLPTNPFVASGSVGSGGCTSNGAPTAACGETPMSIIGESDLSIDNSLVINDYSQTSQPTKTPATNARYADGIYIYPDGGCSSDYDNDSITPSKDIVEIHGNKSVTVGGALKESQRENYKGFEEGSSSKSRTTDYTKSFITNVILDKISVKSQGRQGSLDEEEKEKKRKMFTFTEIIALIQKVYSSGYNKDLSDRDANKYRELIRDGAITVQSSDSISPCSNDQGLDFKLLKVYPYPYP